MTRFFIVAIVISSMLFSTVALAQEQTTDAEEQRVEQLLAAQRTQMQRILDNADDRTDAQRLSDFVDLYYDYSLTSFPEFAIYLGVPGDYGRWTDNSPEATEAREEDARQALATLKSIDRSRLEGGDVLNYDLLLESMQQEIEGQKFQGDYLVINQLGGIHQQPSQLLGLMPARTVNDYEVMLQRLRGVPEQVNQTLHWLRKGLEKGITPPQVTLRDLPEQFDALLVENPMESALARPFADMPAGIADDEQQRLKAQAKQVIGEQVYPALRELQSYLKETYIPGARETIAMGDLPDGKAWYAYNARQSTTTDMTPQQIHDIGKAEVKRIRAEMDKVIEEAGFDGNFAEFTEFLRTDEQFYFDDAEELLAEYRNIAKKADPELVKLFGKLPRTPYGIKPVPEFAAKSSPTAYYQPGSLETGRPGNFFANTYALDTRPKWEMEALTLHEAVPGHHFQIALSQEAGELPWFRRFARYTAFVEGWGLYAESLGDEMGFYQDPYSRFGQLTYEIWRAIRLVVDTGMHDLGWTRQQAIDYFTENTGKSENDIVVEVDRYIVWPGQALAYKIGELKIKELRAYAERELGDEFDIRAFHDALLADGALPLEVLEKRMKAWVADQK